MDLVTRRNQHVIKSVKLNTNMEIFNNFHRYFIEIINGKCEIGQFPDNFFIY